MVWVQGTGYRLIEERCTSTIRLTLGLGASQPHELELRVVGEASIDWAELQLSPPNAHI